VRRDARFIRISCWPGREPPTHVTVTKEAPNYERRKRDKGEPRRVNP